MKYVLYNPLANSNKGEEGMKKAVELLHTETKVFNVVGFDIKKFFDELTEEDEVYIVGGDGTLNRIINALDDKFPSNPIYLYSAGSGNDFLKDTNEENSVFFRINNYLDNLPVVRVKGKEYYFINNAAFGIDGYCCEVGDKLREANAKKIDYTKIAIKGLLFHFKRVQCTVEVDGKTFKYKHTWLAPTMNGRYMGGGMMIAPNQDRLNEQGNLTNIVYHTKTKIMALINFPSIFKGTHVNKKGICTIHTGKRIKVTFSRPTAMQIDGETVSDVLEYEAWSRR